MANLISTTINGTLTVTGQMLNGSNSDQTPWYKIVFYVVGGSYYHVRTPLPADTTYLGWNPSILEVYGYHGIGETATSRIHDFKALINVNGYDNGWYGSQIPMNDGYNSTPIVYRSTNTYGGKTRVCFSIPNQTSPPLDGTYAYLFIRWWNNQGAWNSYAWAHASSNSSTGIY